MRVSHVPDHPTLRARPLMLRGEPLMDARVAKNVATLQRDWIVKYFLAYRTVEMFRYRVLIKVPDSDRWEFLGSLFGAFKFPSLRILRLTYR